MRRFIFFLLFLSLQLTAQNHAFKVNPLGFFNNGIEASYENYVGNNKSFEFVVAVATLNRYQQNNEVKVLGFELKYKFYLQKKNTFKGLYLATAGTLIRTKGGSTNINTILGIGGIAGYQFMLGEKNQKSGFIFDINIGASNYFSNVKNNPNVNNISGFQPRYGVSLGYAF